jgi:hypothetical protein
MEQLVSQFEGNQIQWMKVPPVLKEVTGTVVQMADMEEMKCPEPMDKALYSKVSESAGRIGKRTQCSFEISVIRWPSLWTPGEGKMYVRKVTDAPSTHRRSGSDGMLTRIWNATGEIRLNPGRKNRKLGRHYNCGRRKCAEVERKSEGLVVAKKLRNGNGAKEPNFKVISLTRREAELQ